MQTESLLRNFFLIPRENSNSQLMAVRQAESKLGAVCAQQTLLEVKGRCETRSLFQQQHLSASIRQRNYSPRKIRTCISRRLALIKALESSNWSRCGTTTRWTKENRSIQNFVQKSTIMRATNHVGGRNSSCNYFLMTRKHVFSSSQMFGWKPQR